MGRTQYDLLSIDAVDTFRSRSFFQREETDDSYTIDLDNGLTELISRMTDLVNKGYRFKNCVFTGHGNSGVIWLGQGQEVSRTTWYKHFYKKGFDKLFPYGNARVYFAGCNVAADPHGWAFLTAAARSLFGANGGTAFGWTSTGFGSPISGHERHLWGDTKAVTVLGGGSSLRYYRNWKLYEDENGLPILPEEAEETNPNY
jgi:hypothetical protein